MIIVTGSVVAKPETFDEILALSIEHVERSRKEPGCLSHDGHIDCQNPLRLFFFERWQDDAAIQAHFRMPESRAFVKALVSLAAETTAAQIYRAEIAT